MKELIKLCAPPLVLKAWQNAVCAYYKFQYKELLEKNIALKNIHLGKRCFILGSGPSVLQENILTLKNEIVLALNNFFVHPDFSEMMNSSVSKYYLTAPIHLPQKEAVWHKWFQDMQEKVPNNVTMLIGINHYSGNAYQLGQKRPLFNQHKKFYFFSGRNTGEDYKFRKSDIDLTNVIWGCMSASVYSLMVAIYMGFKEIYLLGMDHNYLCIKNESEYRFYGEASHQNNEMAYLLARSQKSSNYFEVLALYKIFLQYNLLLNQAKIVNLSEMSLADMFERNRLSAILK